MTFKEKLTLKLLELFPDVEISKTKHVEPLMELLQGEGYGGGGIGPIKSVQIVYAPSGSGGGGGGGVVPGLNFSGAVKEEVDSG